MRNARDVLFRTLADPTRRAIFERLCRDGEQTVAALTARAGVSQPAVSKHLRVLKQAGLVRDRHEGRQTQYSAQLGALSPLTDWARQLAKFSESRLDELENPTAEDEPANETSVEAASSHDPALLRRLLRAKDRMDAASHEEWPIARLARASGVSEAHFARSFRQAFGVPPHRYLLTRRLERATALLRDTDLSVTEIAFQTGWESLGTFGRTFRDVTGASPSDLRAREQAAPHELEQVPHCFVSAAHRPDLKIAVSEKRRQEAGDKNGSEETEVPS